MKLFLFKILFNKIINSMIIIHNCTNLTGHNLLPKIKLTSIDSFFKNF